MRDIQHVCRCSSWYCLLHLKTSINRILHAEWIHWFEHARIPYSCKVTGYAPWQAIQASSDAITQQCTHQIVKYAGRIYKWFHAQCVCEFLKEIIVPAFIALLFNYGFNKNVI